MSATIQRTWVCPVCAKGVRAPGRLSKDDTRRWCLKCSADTGHLVERYSPALERKRAEAKAQRVVKLQRQRERAKAAKVAREVIDGVDVGKEIQRLIRLPALADELPGWMRGRDVAWTLERRRDASYSGRAWSGRRIHLSLGDVDAATVKAITAHELAHYVLPYDVHHGGRWVRVYARVLREAYGVDVRFDPTQSKYTLDRQAIEALRARGRNA